MKPTSWPESDMFIELPVVYNKDEDHEDGQEVTDLLCINMDEIYAFNPSSNGKRTSIRTFSEQGGWLVDMAYDNFKERFEAICGEVRSFISNGIEI